MKELEQFFTNNFKKVATNVALAKTTGYRHPSLNAMNSKALAEGKKCFYYIPVDSEKPNGKLMECDGPIYKYVCKVELDEEEYQELMRAAKGE